MFFTPRARPRGPQGFREPFAATGQGPAWSWRAGEVGQGQTRSECEQGAWSLPRGEWAKHGTQGTAGSGPPPAVMETEAGGPWAPVLLCRRGRPPGGGGPAAQSVGGEHLSSLLEVGAREACFTIGSKPLPGQLLPDLVPWPPSLAWGFRPQGCDPQQPRWLSSLPHSHRH